VVGSPTGKDRVLVSTRAVSAAIIPFLLLAFAVLVPWPTDTKRLFAWAIRPTMSAMVLGSVYLGGAYFFLRAGRARRWHTVAGGFPPVASFAALMGIATILHWDRFIHGNVAFCPQPVRIRRRFRRRVGYSHTRGHGHRCGWGTGRAHERVPIPVS
jgi:hypothetical protein